MTIDAAVLWPLLGHLQERPRVLEHEAAVLRADVSQVVQALERPVATYVVDGEECVITAGTVRSYSLNPSRFPRCSSSACPK